jgi:5'(3')-deoxyribonucleotidase
MRIALDMDSVMVEIIPEQIAYIKNVYQKEFKKDDITSWGWLQEHFGFSTGDMIKMYGDIWANKWDELKPTEPNIEQKVERLCEKADVTVVTSGSPEQSGGKIRWLYKYGLKQIPILFVSYGKTKEALPYHIFVDDRQETIEKVVEAGKIGFLFSQPWNTKCKVGMKINSLGQVISFLEGKGI